MDNGKKSSKNYLEEGRRKKDLPLKGAFTDQRDFKGNIHSAKFLKEKEQTPATPLAGTLTLLTQLLISDREGKQLMGYAPMHSNTLTLMHRHSGPVCNGLWQEVCGSSSQNQQRPEKSAQPTVAEGGQMERAVQGMEDAGTEGHEVVVVVGGGGHSLEPPLPETTSRPSHIQINTKPVGSREGRQIRRRQGARGRLEDGCSPTLKSI